MCVYVCVCVQVVCMCVWCVCGHVCMCLNACGHVFSVCLGMCVVCVRAIKDECVFAPQSMRTSRTISTLQLISAGRHATTLGHLLH